MPIRVEWNLEKPSIITTTMDTVVPVRISKTPTNAHMPRILQRGLLGGQLPHHKLFCLGLLADSCLVPQLSLFFLSAYNSSGQFLDSLWLALLVSDFHLQWLALVRSPR